MKKVFFLLIIFGITLSSTAQSVNDSTKNKPNGGIGIKTGLLFNPQGVICGQELEKGFKLETPLFATISFHGKHLAVSPFITLNEGNSFGVFIEYSLKDKNDLGFYTLISKKIETSELLYGIGVSKTLSNNFALFIETDNFFDSKYYFCIGASIPIMVSLNRKH